MKAFVVAFAVIGAMASGVAVSAPMAYGHGSSSCGQFLKESKASEQGGYPYLVWASGFASMASLATKTDLYKGTDTPSVTIWLQNYCQAHPLEPFVAAVVKLLAELKVRQEQ